MDITPHALRVAAKTAEVLEDLVDAAFTQGILDVTSFDLGYLAEQLTAAADRLQETQPEPETPADDPNHVGPCARWMLGYDCPTCKQRTVRALREAFDSHEMFGL